MLIGKRRFISKLFTIIFILLFCVVYFLPRDHAKEPGIRSGVDIDNKVETLQKPAREVKEIRPWDDYYEAQIAAEESKMVPGLGDGGKGVHLQGEEKELADSILKVEAFNLLLSNKIMYNRTVSDARHPSCAFIKYDNKLPNASVVIIFNNERWSSLIRTVYSVLNGSPKEILHEIILVDDLSDHDELKGKLDYYLATRFPKDKVKLLRLKTRMGLVRARLEGAKIATGDVLVFLDAHCEVGITWLEPLLARIKEKRSTVAIPIIDVIDDKTFEYQHNQGSFLFQVGGFTWSGHFTWVDISADELNHKDVQVAPVKSPTMAGGLFAIERNYFWEIGSYDDQMDVWGGENLEMSFRIWQCGGSLETIPCSRVGHIFRAFHPYSFPGNKDTHGINTARTVNVWMDNYKRFFYLHRPDLLRTDVGDISDRLDLRKRLKCHSFQWYLKNVYTEKFVPDENVLAYGRVECRGTQMCLDALQNQEDAEFELGVYSCHSQLYPSQYFSLSNLGELRREFVCATIVNNRVMMTKCSGLEKKQEWQITPEGRLMHKPTNLCISGAGLQNNEPVKVESCTEINGQIWKWEFNPGTGTI